MDPIVLIGFVRWPSLFVGEFISVRSQRNGGVSRDTASSSK